MEEARNHFRKHLASAQGKRTQSFVFAGDEYSFSAVPDGEVYFGVCYPDPTEALTSCKHAAKVNGRLDVKGNLRPYPMAIYGDVLAILKAFDTPEGDYPPDVVEVFALYDASPELFGLMRGAALEVIGVTFGEAMKNSGLAQWTAIFQSTAKAHGMLIAGKSDDAKAEILTAFQLAKEAVADYKASAREQLGDTVTLDAALEAILGNA